MNEEMISANSQPIEPRQENIVQTYCKGIEEKLRFAGSKPEATAIIEAACQNFDSACESDAIRSALRKYLENLLGKYW